MTPHPPPTATAPLAAWKSLVGKAKVEPLAPELFGPDRVSRVVAAGGRAYVLKRHEPGERPSGLVDEYRVHVHLASRGVPVALPEVTDDARLWTPAPDDSGAVYTLAPLLPVDHTPLAMLRGPERDAAAREVGAAIGRLHAALADSAPVMRSYDLVLVPRVVDELYPRLAPEPLARRAEPLLPRLLEVLEVLDGLPTQRIHGDCHTGNVLVHKGKVSGFVDLDHLPGGPRVYDLAYWLAHQARWVVHEPDPAATPDANADLEVRGDRVTQLVEPTVRGYHTANPLASKEIRAVVPMMLASQILLTEWNLAHDQPWYADGLRAIAWTCDHFADLSSAAEALLRTP